MPVERSTTAARPPSSPEGDVSPSPSGPSSAKKLLVGLLEVGLPGVGVELLVVLELLEVFQLGFLVDLLGLRLGAVLYVLKLLVQAHGRPPSRKAPSLGRRGFRPSGCAP